MKKRIIILILMLSLILTPAFVSQAVAFTDYPVTHQGFDRLGISVQVNGAEVVFADQRPTIVNDRTLVPVRGVFEHVGFEVDWDPVSRQAILKSDDYEVILTIGSAEFTTNGVVHTLDVPAQIINERTMLPIRAVLESVGYYVSWDDRNRAVLVSSAPITYITIQGERFSTALTSLELDLDLTDSEIVLLAGLTNLTRLWWLSTTDIDITPLSQLTNLRVLHLYNSQLSDITALAGLTNLTELHLRYIQVSDISPLGNLTNLSVLSITYTPISDISSLAEMTSLTDLSLHSVPITNIEPLSRLTNLQQLGISETQITDLTPLANLHNINTLNLHNNQISNLAPLAGLKNLTLLNLNNNPITDWSPVAHVHLVFGRP